MKKKIQKTAKKKIVKKTKKVTKKKSAKKSAPKLKITKPIGTVTHFYGGIKVAIIKFKKPMKKGAEIKFKGATTDFSQKLKSMQYDHKDIPVAPKGKEIGVKVDKKVRDGDEVFE